MEIWVALILGLLQGFVEFLPISSSGHLVIAEHLFDIDINFVLLNVVLHMATLVAVCIHYRKTLLYMFKNPFCKLNKMLLVATIPAIIAVLLFKEFVVGANHSVVFVGVGFLITAVLLFVSGYLAKNTARSIQVNYRTATFMGLAQALAVLPGFSRSGTTLAVGLIDGAERRSVLDFSFLMSIPIILASAIYELIFADAFSGVLISDWLSIGLASIVAFVAAMFGIRLMQKLTEKINFKWFVLYLLVAGVLTLVFVH